VFELESIWKIDKTANSNFEHDGFEKKRFDMYRLIGDNCRRHNTMIAYANTLH
jgi:hypothetical protein